MCLAEELRQYVAINTHLGMYRFAGLHFSIASGPSCYNGHHPPGSQACHLLFG